MRSVKPPAWACRAVWVGLLLLGGPSVWAVDPDVALHDKMRLVGVAPFCAGLLGQTGPLTPEQSYRKALCGLYGFDGPQRRPQALDLLRSVAPELVEAQIVLADHLQEGDARQQHEALQWYARAAAAGDVRASARRSRLVQRVEAAQTAAAEVAAAAAAAAAAKTSGSPTAGQAADPLFDPMDGADSRQPGYHCHFYGLNRKVCHSAMDQ